MSLLQTNWSAVSVAIAVIVCIFCLFLMREWYKMKYACLCHHKTDLSGKVAIVTGSTSGIGKETARELSKRGARVIIACRNVTKGESVADDIRSDVTGANVSVKGIDLALFESVKKFAEEIIGEETCVDILINNAGVALLPRLLTDDGLEYTFATNQLGHFLLTNLLLDMIEKSQVRRVVVLTSPTYKLGYIKFDSDGELVHVDGMQQYSNTKLMNCLFAQELHRRVTDRGICVFAVSPGIVNTNMLHKFGNIGLLHYIQPLVLCVLKYMFRTPLQGCQTVVYCASVPGIERLSGRFFYNCEIKPWHVKAQDRQTAIKLWEYCASRVERFMPSTQQHDSSK